MIPAIIAIARVGLPRRIHKQSVGRMHVIVSFNGRYDDFDHSSNQGRPCACLSFSLQPCNSGSV